MSVLERLTRGGETTVVRPLRGKKRELEDLRKKKNTECKGGNSYRDSRNLQINRVL